MQRYAFKMYLDPGKEAEYKRRHAEIWPELVVLLRAAGLTNYSIHLDPETMMLFGYLERSDQHRMSSLAADPIMHRWWHSMRHLMRTDENGVPRVTELTEMFHMA